MFQKKLIKNKAMQTLVTGVIVLFSFLLLTQTIKTIKEIRFIGSGVSATNIISVSGEGVVSTIPDIAVFSFGIEDTQNVVSVAQTNVTKISNLALEYLKEQKINNKDIQTTNYNVFPKYRYIRETGKQVLEGYRVSQNITVKIRDIEKVGMVFAGLGEIGVQNINGPSFQVDNLEGLRIQAREKAIEDAKQKAKTLAKALDVNLVRIVSFSENGSGVSPMPVRAFDAGVFLESVPVPKIPAGESDIRSQVNITYEIQ